MIINPFSLQKFLLPQKYPFCVRYILFASEIYPHRFGDISSSPETSLYVSSQFPHFTLSLGRDKTPPKKVWLGHFSEDLKISLKCECNQWKFLSAFNFFNFRVVLRTEAIYPLYSPGPIYTWEGKTSILNAYICNTLFLSLKIESVCNTDKRYELLAQTFA